jgi:hypothetical protein
MENTENLLLPYIMPSQAQAHVTHNEALRRLDAIVQLAVLDRDLAEPPADPAPGARYIVGAGAGGAWSGHEDGVATWQDGAWAFYPPEAGWLAWVHDESRTYLFTGSGWTQASDGVESVNPAPLVGVNETADATNRSPSPAPPRFSAMRAATTG